MQNHQFVTGFASGWLLAAEGPPPEWDGGPVSGQSGEGDPFVPPRRWFRDLGICRGPNSHPR